MIEKDLTPAEPRQPKGTLACLSTGFEIVARHPHLAWVPSLLNLFLWLGPRLSITPLIERVRLVFVQALTQEGVVIPVDQLQAVHLWLSDLRQHVDLFALLKPSPLLGFPLLVDDPVGALFHATTVTPLGPRVEIAVHSLLALMGWVGVLGIIGVVLAAIYLRWIGIAVIGDLELPDVGPEQWPMLSLRLLVLVGGGAVLSIPIGGAIFFFIGFLAMFSMVLGKLFFVLLVSVMILLGLRLLFTVPGMVQHQQGLLRSVYDSIILTQGNMISFMQLVTITLVVAWGLDVVWNLPAPDSWTKSVGILGQALISTALTVALFVYYHERMDYLRVLQQLYIKHAEDGARG